MLVEKLTVIRWHKRQFRFSGTFKDCKINILQKVNQRQGKIGEKAAKKNYYILV
jgi:hypothetical protein